MIEENSDKGPSYCMGTLARHSWIRYMVCLINIIININIIIIITIIIIIIIITIITIIIIYTYCA